MASPLAFALLFSMFPAWNAQAGQVNSAAPATVQPKTPQKPDSIQDPGKRKLSRSEKKEKLRALAEKYRQFLAEVEPIIQPVETDTFLMLESDAQRDLYIEQFWQSRDSDPKTAANEYRETYAELVVEAKEQFRSMASDRSRVYVVRGRPSNIVSVECPRLIQPVEVWQFPELAGMGRNVSLIFYKPRMGTDYKLWTSHEGTDGGLGVLVSSEVVGFSGEKMGVEYVFYTPLAGSRQSKISFECRNGDAIMNAIQWTQGNKFTVIKAFEKPHVDTEDAGRILRTAVIANPAAGKLKASVVAGFPGKRGGRTAAEMTLTLTRSDLVTKEIAGSKFYNIDINGEVLKDGKLFETYHYKFDFSAPDTPAQIPVVFERFLRPAEYTSRIKVTDVNSGSEAIVESSLTVPYIEDSASKTSREAESSEVVDRIERELRSGESQLRLVPLPDDLLTGLQHIETIASGDKIKAVEFYLDNRKVMVKRSPPYTLDLDFGNVPRPRRVKAVGLDADGNVISGDEVTVNSGIDPFRVRIVSPRINNKVKGRVRVEIEAVAPRGKEIANVELYLNDVRLATLYEPPYIQTITVPEHAEVAYLRVVARLKGDTEQRVEDVVFLNAPEQMESVDVHLVELPTTVLMGTRQITDMTRGQFKVFDEGQPVNLAKFEYVRDLPLSVGLAIDTSGSMRPQMFEAQRAAGEFFKNVLRPADKAFVVAFDTQASVVQKWSSNLSDLNAAIASLRAEESTALYDAIVLSLFNFQNVKGQRALVVISDGKDTASKFSFDQALEYAKRAALPIYAIGIGIRTSDIDARFKFSKFANETGGNVYYIQRATELGRTYQDIQNELRSQYVLGFYPPVSVKSGSKWREVNVETSRGKAKTIRGYYP